jgi:hypothetical protein
MTLTQPASACARSHYDGTVKELFADGVEAIEDRLLVRGRRPSSLVARSVVSEIEHLHRRCLVWQI